MRSAKGIHCGNVRGPYSPDEEMDHIARLTGPRGMVTMLHTFAGEMYPRVRGRLGADVAIHVRVYTGNWFGWNPDEFARWSLGELSRIPGLLQDPRVILSFGNEPNLAIEGAPWAATESHPWLTVDNWDYIWRHFQRVEETFLRIAPDCKCVIGTVPVATGHEPAGYPPDWEFQLSSFREYLTCVPFARRVLLAHVYPHTDQGTGTIGGMTEAGDGYWHNFRLLRPKGYRETVQGKQPINGRGDPGGMFVQYPEFGAAITEWGTWLHQWTNDQIVARSAAALDATLARYSQWPTFMGLTTFILASDPPNAVNALVVVKDRQKTVNNKLIDAYAAVRDCPACEWPLQGGSTMPTKHTWKLAFADYAKAHPDLVGECASEISYYRPVNDGGHQLITQFGTKAKLEYNEGYGQVACFPFVR
jgi:hypothetical protein